MLTNGAFYEDLGGDFYTKRNPGKAKTRALSTDSGTSLWVVR
jgi:hypothetical protein